MTKNRDEMLKERFAFDEWRGRNQLDESLLVWRLFLAGDEFPKWSVQRIESAAVAGQPVQTSSIWGQPGATQEAFIRMDLYELRSRVVAHDYLIELLRQFQSPLVGQVFPCGDVAFGGPEPHMLLFARANVVVHLRNAGRLIVPVTEMAQSFDARLIAKPTQIVGGAKPVIQRFAVSTPSTALGKAASLEIEVSEPDVPSVWFKFFSRGGEFEIDDDTPAFRPINRGEHEITMFAISSSGEASRESVRIDVV